MTETKPEQKIFGVIDEIHHTGANSSEKIFKEVTEADLQGYLYRCEQDIYDFIANAKPGEYINWRIPIFRVR